MKKQMNYIHNPILKGFNPDPSIIRVEDDYYIATSTFEWFPGVQIHHSKDLVHWQLITRPLNRLAQLDLQGVPDSCGVWAPCLSYDNGIFYLVYSIVKSFSGVWKDTPNYLVTTNDITGVWSNPVFLSASGFDGSLFHDEDNRKWYVSMLVDHRKQKFFGGIFLQEFNFEKQKLVGPVHHIFNGTEIGLTEGPHLYKKDGYYYLVTAEGGTEYGHAVTIARSKDITGPYKVHPDNPIITCRNNPEYPLQKAGHADFVQTKSGEWITVFLVGRPLSTHGTCILGRETAIETIRWPHNEWPRLLNGTSLPRLNVPIPELPATAEEKKIDYDDFENTELNINFQSLRIPFDNNWCSLIQRKGFLCIRGQESLSSIHRQSMIARRIQSLQMEASTSVDFQPIFFQQMAGLVCYYNTAHFHYLHISATNQGHRCLQIITFNQYKHTEVLVDPIILPNTGSVFLKAILNVAELQFYFALKENQWEKVGQVLDASILSDDYVRDGDNRYRPAFTGAFVGMCCQDLTGNKLAAYFDWFNYQENENKIDSVNLKNSIWEKSF